MGAEEIILPAQLAKTAQGDKLQFDDGQSLSLVSPLPYLDGQELVVAVITKQHYALRKQELARQLLQEIVKQ